MLVLRVALGVMLIWKGINFISDTFVLQLLTGKSEQSFFAMHEAVLFLLPALFTIISGVFISAGVFTGTVALIQLPIFLIGTLFIHAGYIERKGLDLMLTGIIPFLLLMFISNANYTHSGNGSTITK